ncbi:MAG: YraN family protein [Candidatus Wolfebacteria bacterium]|nr:YraN family protein [Candidatus Wolfebacteria bacterium]
MDSTDKQKTGQLGEDLACECLINNRYRIIERNYRKPWGEIDIIAKDHDKTLVFIEVKTLQQSTNFNLKPEDQLTASKLKKVARTASLYSGANQGLINKEMGWRIDLIAITLNNTNNPIISHYKNINL